MFLFSVILTVYIYLKDSSKNKTREELLAEERDYKRRRMSYRGKKVKRSTTQVREITFTLNFRWPFFLRNHCVLVKFYVLYVYLNEFAILNYSF